MIPKRTAAPAVLLLLGLGACEASRVPQPEAPRPRAARVDSRGAERRATDERATERFLEAEIARRSAPPRGGDAPPGDETHADRYRNPGPGARPAPAPQDPAPAPRPTDEAATELFLDHEIERRRAAEPVAPPERIVIREVREVPAYVREPYRYGYDRYRSRFPWGTAVGAGIGAVIGHQSHHRDRGAAIGAGIGLLFDLSRWY